MLCARLCPLSRTDAYTRCDRVPLHRRRRVRGSGCVAYFVVRPFGIVLMRAHLCRHPQHDRGGYYLQDSIIMRGAYGPLGPAKAQLEALRQEHARGEKVRNVVLPLALPHTRV